MITNPKVIEKEINIKEMIISLVLLNSHNTNYKLYQSYCTILVVTLTPVYTCNYFPLPTDVSHCIFKQDEIHGSIEFIVGGKSIL